MKSIASLLLLAFALFGAGFSSAQEKVGKAEKPAPKSKNEIAITPEREAAVLEFVQKNHGELKELLTYLRENRRKDYDKAIRELFRDTERIGQLQGKDGRQYDLELKAWTIKSRIQLLTAHLAMGDKEEIRGQLRGLLNEQMDVRAELLKRERERAQERLSRIDQDLSRLESERQKIIENQLQVLTRSAAASKGKVTKNEGARPGAKKPAKPTVNQPDK